MTNNNSEVFIILMLYIYTSYTVKLFTTDGGNHLHIKYHTMLRK